jgi:hypothetical protein
MGEFAERTKQSLRDSAARARGEIVEVTVEQLVQALPLECRRGAKAIVKKLGPLYRQVEPAAPYDPRLTEEYEAARLRQPPQGRSE